MIVVVEGILDSAWLVSLLAIIAGLLAMTFLVEAYQRRRDARLALVAATVEPYDWQRDGL